jgi:hypothetical protein
MKASGIVRRPFNARGARRRLQGMKLTGTTARAAAALSVTALAALAACTAPPRQAPVARSPSPPGPARPAVPASPPARPAPAVLLPRPGPAAALAHLGPAGGAAPRQFVVAVPGAGVMLGDAATGRLLGRLLPPALGPMAAQGAAVARDGGVWVTYGKPAAALGRTAGGDPQAHTCAGEIVVLRAGAAPRVSVWLRAGDNVTLGQAVPSPDGRLVAYTEAGCATAPSGQFLRVTDLRTRRSWTIGAGLPGCHLFTTPAWSADGRQLAEGYAAANRPYDTPGGMCTGPQTERLLRLDARAPQRGASGEVSSPDGNCQVQSAAGLAGGGTLVLEQCGRSLNPAKDFAALLPLSAGGRPGRQASLGRCTFTRQLAPDGGGRHVLVSAAVDCASSVASSGYRLWSYAGGQRRLVAAGRPGTWQWPLAW